MRCRLGVEHSPGGSPLFLERTDPEGQERWSRINTPNLNAEAAIAWTCDRCDMTVSFAPEVVSPVLPTSWAQHDGGLYCLSCRRERAGDAGLDSLPDDAPVDKRQKARHHALIEFEISRDPGRPDNRIAQACRTSAPAVRKARERLGMTSPKPS